MKKVLVITILMGVSVVSTMTETNAYNGRSPDLRQMVFELSPHDIGITKENFEHPIWGMVMETGFPEGYFTLVSLVDGTTSLYFSNGGGIIGGGEHENVRKASGHYLTGAQHFYKKARNVTNFPTPANGMVCFYFFSFHGILHYTAPEDELGAGKDSLSNLFFAAHGVITELRKIAPK